MNAPEDTGRISWNITQEQEEENNRRIAAEAEHCRRRLRNSSRCGSAAFLDIHEGSGAYDGCFV